MDDKRYTLMNKNRPVLDFLYNLDTHHVVKILKRREPDRLDGFADEARAILSQNPNMPLARIESIVKGVMMQMDSAIDFIENQPSFHRLTPAAAKTKEPNTPDFLDSEVADMKDASAKLLCDSNSGQPSKNLHTEH